MSDEKNYTMKFVSRETGLSPHVIRAWERRYSAITPVRTESNRRLYTQEDLARLKLLRAATLQGHSIGQIARYNIEALAELVGRGQQNTAPMAILPDSDSNAEAPEYVSTCIAAIEQFDSQKLESTLLRASVQFSQPLLLDTVIVPLIEGLGERWQNGAFRIAQEHFASNILRTFLGNMRSAFDVPESAPRMVVTTPAGQLHELGALLAAITAGAEGWHVTYLGPNLPAEEIAAAAQKKSVKAICLSIVYPSGDPRLSKELLKLRRLLSPDLQFLVGGRAANSYRDVLQKCGATIIADLPGLRAELAKL